MEDNALMKMVSLKIYNGVAWLVKIESAYVIFFPFSDGKQPPFFTIFTIPHSAEISNLTFKNIFAIYFSFDKLLSSLRDLQLVQGL